jgi:hypothetical protein
MDGISRSGNADSPTGLYSENRKTIKNKKAPVSRKY